MLNGRALAYHPSMLKILDLISKTTKKKKRINKILPFILLISQYINLFSVAITKYPRLGTSKRKEVSLVDSFGG